MKNLYYNVIIVFLGILIAAFNIDIKTDQSSSSSGYSSYNNSGSFSVTNPIVPNNPLVPINTTPTPINKNVPEVLKQNEFMSAAFDYSLGDARLIGEAGSMQADVALSINPIDGNQLPPLNQGMVNVTADNSGYQMLPKGMIFKNDIDIILPYDTTLLPIGFTPNDIKTYYYDETYKRWIEIPRDSVDEAKQLVISKVNHFTDFINAILKTPEMPETSAYAPTQMNDIKAANPLEGLQMMQPPTANNSGSTSMGYPIEIPSGRQGMQPNIGLSYGGTTASSWVGVGWNLSLPTITVETRWGVPRYDHTLESDLYVLNGDQLVTKDTSGNIEPMPHRTNQWKHRNPSQTEKQYYPRLDEAHDSIVRHGTNPTNYWWSVTDKNGITSYYGKMHDSENVNPNAVLTDAKDNIAHWCLTETRDINGNTVRYYYSIDFHSGLINNPNASLGKEIYIDSINYTGFVDAQNNYQRGIYSVEFYRSHDRDDITINGNYGFKRVDSKFLCHITILTHDAFIKSYQFSYSYATRKTNFKNLLLDIYRLDEVPIGDCFIDGDLDTRDSMTFINSSHKYIRTKFDYFPVPESNSIFGVQDTIFGYDDDVNSFFISDPVNLAGMADATGLGATRGYSWNAGGTGTVGGGPIVILSSASVGGNFDYSQSKNEGALTLIDLDGDGLSDKVFKEGNHVYFRKHIVLSNGKHAFDSNKRLLSDIDNFQCDVGENTAWGLQASLLVNYGGSWPGSKSTTITYFSDVNADGLPDLITEEGVLFNTLVNGVPTFVNLIQKNYEDSTNTHPDVIVTSAFEPCGSIIFDGYVNDSIECFMNLVLDTIIENKLELYPYQQFLNDYGDSTIYLFFYKIIDRVSFRAEVYRKEIHCEPISLNPDIDAVKTWVAPKPGNIRIISEFQLLEDTTTSRIQARHVNGVRYSIESCNDLGDYNNYLPNTYVLNPPTPNNLIDSLTIGKDDYEVKKDTFELYVSENTILFFRLQSQGNRDFDKVSWIQDIQYIDNLANDPIEDHYNSKKDFLVTGIYSTQVPETGYIDGEINISCGDLNNQNILFYVGPNILPINSIISPVSLQSNMNTTIPLPHLGVNQYDNINFYVYGQNVDKNDTIWKEINIIPAFYFTPLVNTTITDTLSYKPIVNFFQINHVNPTILDTVFNALFGPMYRGWGQFGYNNNDPNSNIEDLIDVSKLKRNLLLGSDTMAIHNAIYSTPDTTSLESENVTESFENNGIYNPLSLSTRWIEMIPNNYHQAWIGYGNINYITKEMMSNTRIKGFFTVAETDDIPTYDSPVPQSTSTLYGPKTVRKVSESTSKNKSGGLPIPVISLGVSHSKSSNNVRTDYMDLNGDRYPDVLSDLKVQYTKPWGGIDPNTNDLDATLQVLTLTESDSYGANFGASYPVAVRVPSSNPKKAKMTVSGNGSPGGNLGDNIDETFTTWMDVNGDGLPDKVNKDSIVALNLGYGFTPFENWHIPTIREGSSFSTGTNFGMNFNVAQGSIGGGVGVGISENNTERMLMDFNGDGIPDLVTKNNNQIDVQYNLGNGTYSAIESFNLSNLSFGLSLNESINASFNIGFTVFGSFKVGLGLSASPYNKSFSKDKVQIVDIDGDGYVDYVTSDDENIIKVRYNTTGKANLLQQVTNFTGSTIVLDYEMPISSYDQPQRSWVLKSVKTHDPYSPIGAKTSYTKYEYKNPKYNRFERISYGYDTVITYQMEPVADTIFRKTIQGFNNKNFIKKGRKTSETVCDASGKKYIETYFEVNLVDDNGTPIQDNDCPDFYFPNRECEIVNYYEGQSSPQITTKKCVEYDQFKNIVAYYNEVDSANNVTDDNLKAIITYKTNMPFNKISLVDEIKVYNSDSTLIRQKSAVYDNMGRLIQINQYNYNDIATVDLEYDTYGNVNKIIYPENINAQRMWFQYVYDPVVHTYPITVTSALGYQSSAEYNYKWGKPTKTFDINGQEMRFKYDYIGRVTEIIGPNELAANAPYTIKMEYYPANYSRYSITIPTVDTFSYAVTSHYNEQDPSNPLKTTLLCDGLGRVIQTKKDIEINGVELSGVSGKVVFDAFGRTVKQYYPITEALTQYNRYNYAYDTNTVTTTRFDVLDREIRITLPNSINSYMQYTFGNDAFGIKRFLTIATDPNGNRVKTYTDPRKLQTTLIADSTIVTTFEYSAMGELLQSTDPDNHSTYYSYNKFGQKISRTHPDAGTDLYTYDIAGNLLSRQTQDLLNNNMFISYNYNYNQMTVIHYPKNPENDVHYYYGDNNAPNNRKGRVWAIEDASGRQEFSYGRMGEVIGNIRTFALPNESNTYTFAMSFEYDSWNRILSTTYPDGEFVRYWYNKGAQLRKMTGSYNNGTYNYIDSIYYNKFEKRTKICYGNGTKAEYTYDILQRLSQLKSTSASGVMQRIEYTFDNVNNIQRIDNSASMLSNGLGGTYRHDYSYDHLYRLTSSTGNWQNNNTNLSYGLNMTYEEDGRIKTKIQNGTTLINGVQSGFSYRNVYSYNANQSHTINRVDNIQNQTRQDFAWDANGNLVFHKTPYPTNITRNLCWDEENRLMAVGDNRYTSYYVYDNGGERTYKLTGPNTYMNINGNWMNFANMDNPTLYTSAYLVANMQGYTKHYYAGSERIASAIGLGGLSSINIPIGLVNYEHKWENKSTALNVEMTRTIEQCLGNRYSCKKTLGHLYQLKVATSGTMLRYFYHPDHLGSSSWITDGSGNAIQHLHYLPFGEDWVDQRNSSWNTPYTFSGKEKDTETGYGYFGARYYDSGLSIWLSVDPMSDKYPNLSPYNYCANNPVMLVDPDGRTIFHPDGGFMEQYGNVYSNLKLNSTYQSLISKYNNTNIDLRFGRETGGNFYGITHGCKSSQTTTKNGISSTTSTYDTQINMNPDNMQTEIGLVKTFLHEAVHAYNRVNGISTPENHEGFDRQSVLDGLIEYNQTFGLGYSSDQLETISWSGLQDSPEFRTYITERATRNNTTYDQEVNNWALELHSICDVE